MRFSPWLTTILVTITVSAVAQAQPSPQHQPTYGPDNPRPGSARANLRSLMQEHLGEPMPEDRRALDTAFAQDQGGVLQLLRAQKNPRQIYLDLNWERARIYDGAGFAISLAYMEDLWRIAPDAVSLGTATNGETPEGLRQTAVAFALYNEAIIRLDGTRCADVSAPSHRLDQLTQIDAPILTYGRKLAAEEKEPLVTVAINVERGTAPARKDDPVLCSGGLTEIQQGLTANGDKPLLQSHVPGYTGTTVHVPDAPGYKPAYVVPEKWRPEQRELRASLRSELEATLAVVTGQADRPG